MARIYQRKPGGIYWIDYFADGRRIRESTGSSNKKTAERCLQSRLGDVVQNKFNVASKRPSPPFREFSKEYLEWAKANKRSWDRDEIMIKNLMPTFGHLRLADTTPRLVETYKTKRATQVSKSTVNREVALLKRISNLAVEWNIIELNPIAKVKMFKEPPPQSFFLTQEEAERLVEVCRPPFRWIVITALHTGMRRNEILFLKWEHVDLVRRKIHVLVTKNGEPRIVDMDDTVFNMLNSIPRKSEYIFAQENGKPYADIKRPWSRAKERAGISCRFHDLRHTFASHLVMQGVDLLTVKELLGHKSLKMVERYAHLSDEHRRNAVQLLDNALTGAHGTKQAHGVISVDFKEASNQ